MKELIKRISWCVIIVLGAMVLVECCENKELKQDNQRLKNNQTALVHDIEGYRLKDSSYVAEITALRLQKSEFQTLYYKTAKEVKDLGVKLKRLQNVTTSQTEHLYIFDTLQVYDSVVMFDTLKCFEYADSWIRFSGCLNDDFLMNTAIQTFDTVLTAVSKEYRKRFLFFHWKPYYKVTLHSKNPYSTITGAEYVEIVK